MSAPQQSVTPPAGECPLGEIMEKPKTAPRCGFHTVNTPENVIADRYDGASKSPRDLATNSRDAR